MITEEQPGQQPETGMSQDNFFIALDAEELPWALDVSGRIRCGDYDPITAVAETAGVTGASLFTPWTAGRALGLSEHDLNALMLAKDTDVRNGASWNNPVVRRLLQACHLLSDAPDAVPQFPPHAAEDVILTDQGIIIDEGMYSSRHRKESV